MYLAVAAQRGVFRIIKRDLKEKKVRQKEMGELFIHLPLNFLAAMPVLT